MLKKISYYTSTLDESDPLKRLCNPLDLLLFDIETTGFHRVNDQVISITAAQVSSVNSLGEYTWEITQWFTDSLDDEKIMLLDANILFKTKPIHNRWMHNVCRWHFIRTHIMETLLCRARFAILVWRD